MAEGGTGVENGPLQIVLEVDDHESLELLMGTLTGIDIDTRTKSITLASLSQQTTATVELDVLTEKQRETLELAIQRGYYEQPREADLTDLAAEFNISKSAVSQRLRTAERKLIKAAFAQYV